MRQQLLSTGQLAINVVPGDRRQHPQLHPSSPGRSGLLSPPSGTRRAPSTPRARRSRTTWTRSSTRSGTSSGRAGRALASRSTTGLARSRRPRRTPAGTARAARSTASSSTTRLRLAARNDLSLHGLARHLRVLPGGQDLRRQRRRAGHPRGLRGGVEQRGLDPRGASTLRGIKPERGVSPTFNVGDFVAMAGGSRLHGGMSGILEVFEFEVEINVNGIVRDHGHRCLGQPVGGSERWRVGRSGDRRSERWSHNWRSA